MQLIGMLDSPFVRRVAISLEALGIPFEHKAVSVFSTFEQFQRINPVLKAPTLICDDGQILMDSSLILQYAHAMPNLKNSLWSTNLTELQHQLRIVGLALAACEKSAQIIYERNLRPKETQYEPWITRVTGQLLAAYKGLEKEAGERGQLFTGALNEASITTAVAWQRKSIVKSGGRKGCKSNSTIKTVRFPPKKKGKTKTESVNKNYIFYGGILYGCLIAFFAIFYLVFY